MAQESKGVKVVIIGAGIGGLSTAINLKRQLGFSNFTIFEKGSEVGGTWRDNTYPGCACDVPVHWYSLSSELNPNWTQYYAEQPEILTYWKGLAEKHQLYSHIVFGTRVTSLTWDNNAQAWKIEIEMNSSSGDSKERCAITAQLVVSAAGGFVAPGYSNLEGRDVFQGEIFHSARWNHSVKLDGKRVGVIGNGCSATQFIPRISRNPSVKVINFCRTPNWVIPKFQFQYPAIAKWIFRHIPLVARVYRNIIFAFSELSYRIWPQKNTRIRNLAERQVLGYMKKTAPERYHEKLTPSYPLGCKRIIVDPDYYASLHRSNVELEWGGVREIVKDGLITNDGKKHSLDVIIYGTGFLLIDPELRTTGRGGQTLYQYFESRGGPEAYVGTTVPGFPNLFLILGPNVATGHASAIFSEEQQIGYALQLMQPVIEGKARSLEVRREVSHRYNDTLQRRLGETIWVSCQSYYRSDAGKIIATFPGPVMRFWYLTRKVKWSEYVAVGAEEWERETKVSRIKRRAVLSIVTALLAFAWETGQLWR